jgi:triacylglycerol lipase
MNLVLAHGFLGFKRLFGVDYFNGVAGFLCDAFPDLGLKVLVTEVNPLGRIHQRGNQLKGQIAQALANGALDPLKKTHVIAHSMGGLDARYCVSPGNSENIASQIASLTTISTPHRGSPVADFFTGRGGIPETLGERLEAILDLGGGILDLTTAGAAQFNERYPNHSDVQYFSYAGRGREGGAPTSVWLLPAYYLIGRKAGPANDGLVSVESAVWGESPEPPWPADHADEIGHDLNRLVTSKPAFDYLAKYRTIVERLAGLAK